MQQKTTVSAEEGKQEVVITREFDLPLELLFKAFTDPEIIEQWKGIKVLKHEGKKHGSYQAEIADANGNVVTRTGGVIHAFVPNQKITRTFEIENAPFGVQLEIYTFEGLTDDTSRLNMHVIYESVEQRDLVIRQMPYALDRALDRLQEVMNKEKSVLLN
jgi:uncharacterized protein YndB with AHSA1/START domain